MGSWKCDVRHIRTYGIWRSLCISGEYSIISIYFEYDIIPSPRSQWLTWPSRANKSFPYHVRTNHVGIASDSDDGADYPRHTYEPSTTVDQNIIIPLSRRTEELINGIYGQYIYEHQGQPNANLHSHASFPEDPNAPPEILSTAQLQLSTQFALETENDLHKSHAQNRFGAYLEKAPPTDGRPPVFSNEIENQVDSGHPSLDHSGDGSSPSNNTTKSVSDHGSPESIKSDTAVNAEMKPPPNKIILEPIEQSIRNMRMPTTANVPKHLFAARKLPSDWGIKFVHIFRKTRASKWWT